MANAVSKPLKEFLALYKKAKQARPAEVDAMVLATSTKKGRPSARVVLYKGLYENGVVFYSNYRSRKAQELEANPYAALAIFYPTLGRQIRFEGKVFRIPAAMADTYWATRPRESQIGGVASPQSQVIQSYAELAARAKRLEKLFKGQKVPRPQHWGGYVLIPDSIEFWKLGVGRLHQRYLYSRKKGNTWTKTWLGP